MSGDFSPDGFLGHLAELRTRLMRAAGAVLLLFFAFAPFAPTLYEAAAAPLLSALPVDGEMIAIGIIDPLWVPLKFALFCAFVIALPYVLFEAWRFVAPGLYRREKRLVLPLVVSSTLLFYAGMAFAYLLVFKVMFGFIAAIAPGAIKLSPDIAAYFSFAMTLFIAFGAAFETPVAVFLLVRAGVVSADALRRARPHVVIGLLILGMLLTPPDIFSQLLLAIPCWLLFEIGLFFAARWEKSRPAEEEADEEDEDENEESDKELAAQKTAAGNGEEGGER